jgi:hypothetical protein
MCAIYQFPFHGLAFGGRIRGKRGMLFQLLIHRCIRDGERFKETAVDPAVDSASDEYRLSHRENIRMKEKTETMNGANFTSEIDARMRRRTIFFVPFRFCSFHVYFDPRVCDFVDFDETAKVISFPAAAFVSLLFSSPHCVS